MPLSTTVTTAATTLANNYKKIQIGAFDAFKKSTEEWEWARDVKDGEFTLSAREMTFLVDLERAYGAAMIPEGGYEARTVTTGLREGSVTWVSMNQRFSATMTAKHLDQKARDGMMVNQIKHQAVKAFESMSRLAGLQFYGLTTGVVAKCSATQGAAASHTITLIDAYGQASFDNAAYLASLFVVGQGVALIQGGALVTNALGTITAVTPATPSIAVTWDGSVSVTANDEIVFRNAVTDATITASDYSRWPVGLIDAITSTSLHGISGATYAEWNAALNNSSGGRFDHLKVKAIRQALKNKGDGKLTDLIISNGVENDAEAGERAARVYDSASFDLDGSVKVKGVSIRTSALVPPGCAFGYDKSAVCKKLLTPEPTEESPSWEMADKAQDRNFKVFSVDLEYLRLYKSRRKLALYSGLSEQ